MMRKIFLFLLFSAYIYAMPLAQIKPNLEVDLKSAMSVLATSKSVEQKSNELFKIFDKYFDYETMARLALGGAYKNLNEAQIKEFNQVFEKRLKFSFSEKLSLYTNQKVSITGDLRPNDKRYFINSQIKNDGGEIFELVFKFHKKSNDDFLLYDVDILGVSIIQTYRAQFDDLKNASFDEILARLNAKNALDEK